MKFDLTDICGTKHEMDTENWGERFINIDCMDALKAMPDKCVDLCIVDPPYGIGIDGQIKNDKTSRLAHEFKGWDSAIPNSDYFVELLRVSKNQIIWGGNYMTDHLSASRCWLIWDKIQEFSGSSFEMAWTSFDSPAKSFKMARCVAYTGIDKIHPTQKPIALYKWLLSNYAKPGDKILDTHVGSASSLIACHQMGFEYWGFELDTDYYKAATERLNRAKAQVDIFEAAGIPRPEQLKLNDPAQDAVDSYEDGWDYPDEHQRKRHSGLLEDAP